MRKVFMRAIYRAFLNRVGSDTALALAHDLEHWHGAMVAHRDEMMMLGFAPDGHAGWEDCPHAEARRLWNRAVQLLGRAAGDLELLRACALPADTERDAFVRRPWVLAEDESKRAAATTGGMAAAAVSIAL
ncbi:MAG: hypothetical protein LC791_12715 [Acidobacteria bacterium]|nr:hypothetical protein [Acidobacteriota bacterium]